MPFEIRDADGVKIPMEQLNEEASKFWGMPIVKHRDFPNDPDYLTVFPIGYDSDNWVNSIGEAIETPYLTYKVFQQSWEEVKLTMFNHVVDKEQFKTVVSIFHRVNRLLVYNEPFYLLIEYWEAKGYIPVRIS